MTNSSSFIYVFIALFVGVGLGFIIGRGRKATGSGDSLSGLQAQIEALNGQLTESRSEVMRERSRNETENAIAQQMREMQQRMRELQEQSNNAHAERVKAETQIQERVASMNDLNTELVNQTRSLSNALNNSKERGNFGEVQLENLLRNSGLQQGIDFERQRATSDSTIPDIKLNLPDGNVLFIDSKVPFNNFQAAFDTEDQAARAEFLKKHVQDIRKHAKDLAAKQYQNTGDSPNYVVMFLPFDSLLIEALKSDTALLGDMNKLGISLTSPLTLWPLLQNIKYVIGLQRVSSEIHSMKDLAKKFINSLRNVQEGYEKIGNNIKALINTYNGSLPALETTVRNTARNIAEFVVDGELVEKVSPVDKEVRKFKNFAPAPAENALQVDNEDPESDDVVDAEVVEDEQQ